MNKQTDDAADLPYIATIGHIPVALAKDLQVCQVQTLWRNRNDGHFVISIFP
jgi:hypothetical protein